MSDPATLTMARIQSVSALPTMTARGVFARVARAADSRGHLSRAVFRTCVAPGARGRAGTAVLDQLFDVYARADAVVARDLAGGLSLLCDGSRDDKVADAFAWYGGVALALADVALYLTSVFRLIFATQPATRARLGVDPRSLADICAAQAFADAGVDANERLTAAQFKVWYAA